MEKIELTLKNEKLKSYHLISWILALLNFIVQLTFTLTDTYRHDRVLVIGFFLIMVLLLVVRRGNKFDFIDKKNSTATMYVLICVIWAKWGLYWLAGLNVVFYLLYIYATRKFEVIILRDKIIFPSFSKRNIPWTELQNIIMKDGILTIDFKNNSILQNEVEGDDYFKEKEFNAFCREQLNK
jgi:hypothetical protein